MYCFCYKGCYNPSLIDLLFQGVLLFTGKYLNWINTRGITYPYENTPTLISYLILHEWKWKKRYSQGQHNDFLIFIDQVSAISTLFSRSALIFGSDKCLYVSCPKWKVMFLLLYCVLSRLNIVCVHLFHIILLRTKC